MNRGACVFVSTASTDRHSVRVLWKCTTRTHTHARTHDNRHQTQQTMVSTSHTLVTSYIITHTCGDEVRAPPRASAQNFKSMYHTRACALIDIGDVPMTASSPCIGVYAWCVCAVCVCDTYMLHAFELCRRCDDRSIDRSSVRVTSAPIDEKNHKH